MKKTVVLFCLLSFFLLPGTKISSAHAADNPIVQDIKAEVANASFISISWKLPSSSESITKFWLYRSSQPMTRTSDLQGAVKIAELDHRLSGWTDTLPDYNEYYYAVIAVTDKPYNIILPSINATATGISMPVPVEKPAEKIQKPEKLYESGTKRETPLPYLDVGTEVKDTSLKEELSKHTIESVKELTYFSDKKQDVMRPYFFEEDLISPDSGDDFLLFSILKDYFIQRDYKNSIIQLKKLIGTNITDAVQNRAYFYLGEAQFFSGEYEESVKTFVKISQIYPQQTKKWIDTALDNF